MCARKLDRIRIFHVISFFSIAKYTKLKILIIIENRVLTSTRLTERENKHYNNYIIYL